MENEEKEEEEREDQDEDEDDDDNEYESTEETSEDERTPPPTGWPKRIRIQSRRPIPSHLRLRSEDQLHPRPLRISMTRLEILGAFQTYLKIRHRELQHFRRSHFQPNRGRCFSYFCKGSYFGCSTTRAWSMELNTQYNS